MTSNQSKLIHEEIYRVMRSRIMYGEIKPGKPLSIRGLATEFSVSMTPIRDVVRRLIAEGALAISTSGRISIPTITGVKVKELLGIRLILEPELAIRAIPRVHSALIERLYKTNALLEEMISVKNSVEVVKINIEFHKILYLRAQAPTMLALLEMVWLQSGLMMKIAFENDPTSFKNFSRSKILSSLEVGDHDHLISSIKDDITTNLQMLLA